MVLCVTHSNDEYTIDHVMDYFERNNRKAIRLNTDQLLKGFWIVKTIDENGCDIVVESEAFRFKISEISGVWFRKIWPPSVLNEVDERYRESVGKEVNTSLFNFFSLLEEQVPCINSLVKTAKIEGNKFFQLCQAKKVGLKVPNTIVTSQFDEVKRFYESHDGDIIAKLQHSLGFSMQVAEKFFPTTKITKENLELLKGTLDCCPMIFQNNIPKAYELRVAYIEGVCYTGKIDATKTENGKQDWRYSEGESAFWAPYELPEDVIDKIDLMMHQFGLSFGAIDLICQPNGEYVFLEVNPSGEWGMLQRDLGYPIAETIAKKLLKRIDLYEE